MGDEVWEGGRSRSGQGPAGHGVDFRFYTNDKHCY